MSGAYGLRLGSLTETGGQVVDLAEDARRVISEFVDGVRRHDGRNAGFATTSQLSGLCSGWQAQLNTLCQRTTTAGDLLNVNDQTYGELETAVTGSLDRIEPGGASGLVS